MGKSFFLLFTSPSFKKSEKEQTGYSILHFRSNPGYSQVMGNMKSNQLHHRSTRREDEQHERLSDSVSQKPITTILNHCAEGGIRCIKCNTVSVCDCVTSASHVLVPP